MRYLKEIMKYLQENSKKETYSDIAMKFFKICQEYYYYYLINDKISDAKKVLKNYMDEENYLVKRKLKSQEESKKQEPIRLEIEEKMYVELLLDIYNQYYADDYSWAMVVDSQLRQEKMLKEHLKNVQQPFINNVTQSVEKSSEYAYKKPDITNIHKAMETLKEALNISMPQMEESVENVISSEYLELLFNQLKCDNFGGFIMTVGQIRRELTVGAYHKYTKGNTNAFFNLKSEYNLTEMRNYIIALKDLLALYTDTKEEIENLK